MAPTRKIIQSEKFRSNVYNRVLYHIKVVYDEGDLKERKRRENVKQAQ